MTPWESTGLAATLIVDLMGLSPLVGKIIMHSLQAGGWAPFPIKAATKPTWNSNDRCCATASNCLVTL